MSELKVDSIEAREIVLSHPDGKKKIVLSAQKSGAGVWVMNVDNSTDHMISIYSFNGQTAIGLSNQKLTKGYELALHIDENSGDPCIQMIDHEGNVEHFSIEDLRSLKGKPDAA